MTALDTSNIQCQTPCNAKLQTGAATSLAQAAANQSRPLLLSSAWRSSAQQYLLYQWYLQGKCGIPVAAKPGMSNHEGGRAIDTPDYSFWLSTLQAFGFSHDVVGDDVHFDYLAAPDLASQNLKAFQSLWNRQNPGKTPLNVDGMFSFLHFFYFFVRRALFF